MKLRAFNDPVRQAEVTPASLVQLAQTVGEALIARRWMCATAESCTGGLIGHLITENRGSSAYLAGCAVTYSYEAKERVLGVHRETLLAHGAVSSEVAAEMAQGALRLYATDVAVSVTGIAGPAGGLPGKPVGTVCIHLSAADGYERAARFVWPADRGRNKLLSAWAALEMMREYLSHE